MAPCQLRGWVGGGGVGHLDKTMHRPSCRAEANLPTVIINGVHATKPKGAVHYNIYCFFYSFCGVTDFRCMFIVWVVVTFLTNICSHTFCHCTLLSFFLFLYSEI